MMGQCSIDATDTSTRPLLVTIDLLVTVCLVLVLFEWLCSSLQQVINQG